MKSKNSKQHKKSELKEKFDPYFILEQYIFYQRIQWIKQMEESKTLDYKEFGKHMLYQNLYLKKLRLDPGFKCRIYAELGNDKESLRKIKRIIIPFLQEKEFFTYPQEIDKELQKDLNYYEDKVKIENMISSSHPDFFTSPFFSTESKKYWFYKKWRYYMNFGKSQESYASESMLMELITGYFHGHYLFWTSNPYGLNRNGHHYYLAALKEVSELLDPYFLDYIDAQRWNILVCEQMQDIVDTMDYNELNSEINEYFEHFQDIIGKELNPLETVKVKRDILKIVSLIYFNFLSFSKRTEFLEKFYGIDHFITFIIDNKERYTLSNFIGNLPEWYFFGFLQEIRELMRYYLESRNIKKDIQTFILIKYLCKSYVEQNECEEAFQLLFSERIPFLQECRESYKKSKDVLISILDPSSRIQIELLYLLATISIKSEKKNIFKFVNQIYDLMIELSEDVKIQYKILTIKSILYRLNKNFRKEREILNRIQLEPKQLMKSKDTNPFEIVFSLFPPRLMISESFHYKDNLNFIQDFVSVEILEREPLIALRYELYILYADLRKKQFSKYTEEELFYFDNFLELVKYLNRGLNSQSMASFRYILKYQPLIHQLAINERDREGLRLISETLAFPFLYLKDFETSIGYLNDALFFKPDDTYYKKYLIILYLFMQEYSLASNALFKLYHIENHSTYQKVSGNIKSLFQFLMIWFKEKEFDKHIIKMLSESQYITKFVEKLDIIYCDIGLSLADLGYFEAAHKYFNKALDIVHNEKFKASLLCNIGTVYSDQIQLDTAIEYFEKSIEIDPDHPTFWLNLAKMYQFRLNYIKAKEIYLDAEYHFKNSDEKITKIMLAHSTLMDMHIRGIINLNIVHETDALKHFKLAEQLIKNLNTIENLTENTGIIFLELTNGVDCCFNATVSKLVKDVLEQHYTPGSKIPRDDWNKLSFGLQKVWNGQHMSIGHIEHLIGDLLKPNLDPVLADIMKKLLEIVNLENLKTFQEYAKLAAPTRNPSGHGGILNKTEFINNISKLIEVVNKTLVIFDKFY
ncbi:MAG: tetratricopeptide repeat protein [Candidatus Lokiarchaeota archaeon]|nr:tetratricopeptide repeat protein [Candidatus Lokiarchaeota archaeon]